MLRLKKNDGLLQFNLHRISIIITFSNGVCTFQGMGFVKMKEYHIDSKYYINVASIMNQKLPRPKHRSRFIVNDGEILPIILVECEV